jgi:dihydroxy-acid dehydratase
MLRAVGITDADWDKPQIAIASSWNEVTPCNVSLRRLAERAKEGVRAAGGVPLEFGTITVSDGISMGHEGMRASLVSREVICDSVETVMHAERFDGFVGLAGCDKSIPAMLMAAARLNLPSVFVYNGSTLPGYLNGTALDITSVFEAVGACATGTITEAELSAIERNACPGEGACGGMFTANTMSSIAEALGMSLPGSASPPAVDRRREDDARVAGALVVRQLELGIFPRDILTKKAFENAIAVTNALGGSTNAVLHLLALANEAGVELSLEDFNRVAARVPHIADMKPGGKFHMTDLDRVGGVPVVLKHLLEEGLLHGDCLTVTGRTMAENLAEIGPPAPDGVVVHPVSNAIDVEGGINILTGSLAPSGSVVKVAGLTHGQRTFEGPARVFDGEQFALDAILAGDIQPGTVLVIRYEGPEGRPRMREMLAVTGALKGAGRGHDCASSPTAGSRAARGGSASATWHRRRWTAAPSRSSATVTASASTFPPSRSTCSSIRRNSRTGWTAGLRTLLATRPACSASTPSSCKAPRPAPSPTRCNPAGSSSAALPPRAASGSSQALPSPACRDHRRSVDEGLLDELVELRADRIGARRQQLGEEQRHDLVHRVDPEDRAGRTAP